MREVDGVPDGADGNPDGAGFGMQRLYRSVREIGFSFFIAGGSLRHIDRKGTN